MQIGSVSCDSLWAVLPVLPVLPVLSALTACGQCCQCWRGLCSNSPSRDKQIKCYRAFPSLVLVAQVCSICKDPQPGSYVAVVLYSPGYMNHHFIGVNLKMCYFSFISQVSWLSTCPPVHQESVQRPKAACGQEGAGGGGLWTGGAVRDGHSCLHPLTSSHARHSISEVALNSRGQNRLNLVTFIHADEDDACESLIRLKMTGHLSVWGQ